MQTIWKGAISFGLVSIPVRVFSATDERGVSFRQVHAADGGRIRYKRVCELDGEEVPYSDIAKGYDLGGGDIVVLTDSDLEQLPLASSKSVDVMQFVDADEFDMVAINRSYYLQADQHGAKPYVLLRDALARSGKVAIVKVALRQRESLAAIRAHGDILVMQMMLWPEEIRDPSSLAPDSDVAVREQEIAMAESYIETMSGAFKPEDYTDEYAAALHQVVEAKVAGREVVTVEETAEPAGEVVDLMEALRQSVARAKERRAAAGNEQPTKDGEAPTDGEPAKKAAAKKTPAKKAAAKAEDEKPAAKKTAAKKAPAKKAAAKKSA